MKVDMRRRADAVSAELLADPRVERLAAWGARLAGLGVAPAASGNLSFRTRSGFLVTRTGVELRSIGPADWVEVLEIAREPSGGLAVTYQGLHEPSRDAFVHGTVYERSPEAEAVFHLHDGEMVSAGPALGIPSTERFYPAGTVESVAEIEALLTRRPDASYFILVEHGVVAWGRTIDAAGELIESRHREVG